MPEHVQQLKEVMQEENKTTRTQLDNGQIEEMERIVKRKPGIEHPPRNHHMEEWILYIKGWNNNKNRSLS